MGWSIIPRGASGVAAQSDQLFEELLQFSQDAIIVLDRDYFINVFNLNAELALGHQSKDVVGTNFLALCQKIGIDSPIDPSEPVVWEDSVRTGVITEISSEHGQKKSINWTIKQLKGKEENVEGFLLVGSMQASLSFHHYLENVLATLPGSVYWKDKNGVYLGCNETLLRMAGLDSMEEIVGKTDYQLCWKDHADQWRKTDLEIMRSGLPRRVEETVTLADGSFRIEFSHKAPLRDDTGNVVGIMGTALDITRLKAIESRLQEAKQRAVMANHAKSNFLATMSHELRTPMNAIIGMAQVLAQKNLTDECEEYVDIIHLSGKNLLALINDILDFSKLEAHKVEIESKPIDFRRLVDEIASSMRNLAEDKGIRLTTRYSNKAPAYIIGDGLRLRQILVNLVGNAIKFTRDGRIAMTVSCEAMEDSIASLFICVKDTGIGIPSDRIGDVFDRFTQVESQYSRRFAGSGLGLSISKQLIEAMGGRIGVKSVLHKGSTFWLRIPFKVANEDEIQEAQTQKEDEQYLADLPKLNQRLLLVEDNKMNQRVVQVMLQETGCTIDIAENGKEAINLFENNHYDLVFMDVGLPDMDGLQVTEYIRSLGGYAKTLPIIAMTAHALEEDQQNCLKAGADEVVIKPVMQPTLMKTLHKWLLKKSDYLSKPSIVT